jgi:HAMP domain-containing protein
MRAKMVGIVLVFPLLFMAAAAFVFLQQAEGLVSDLNRYCSRAQETAAASVEGPAGPVIRIQDGIAAFIQEAAITAALILGGAFFAVVFVVLVFGLRLAGRVRTLSEAAARISTGDLAAEVETGSRDELGILAEALARLREKLRRLR